MNIGEKGFFLWKIEPNDNIYLKADGNDFDKTLTFSGEGSGKWNYLKEQIKTFEVDKDWDYELENLKKISKKGYYELTEYLYNEQIKLLNKHQKNLSSDFYSLQRADIYGKYSSIELAFLNFHQLFNEQEFSRFQLKTFNSKTQSKSYEFGHFVEALIDNHNKLGKKYNNSILVEFDSIKRYFDELDLVDKQLIDRILANKILNYIDNQGLTEETKLLIGSYKNFTKNKVYLNALLVKQSKLLELQPGRIAKTFILPDEKGNLVSLKDFRGKNILLGFYASWCGPCISDQQNIKIVENYFKENNDFVYVFISMDTETDFKAFLKSNAHSGIHLLGTGNQELIDNYATESLPNYFLIDKTGTIISERIEEPSSDEGRSLIRQIERLIYKK